MITSKDLQAEELDKWWARSHCQSGVFLPVHLLSKPSAPEHGSEVYPSQKAPLSVPLGEAAGSQPLGSRNFAYSNSLRQPLAQSPALSWVVWVGGES